MPLVPGARLGPYEITGSLGAGGMGEVYRARDTRLDRTVAIKVLPASLAADASFSERFEREARSLSALNHPNICTVHDVGRLRAEGASADQGEVSFLVMEHLEGRTLAAILQEGPLSVDEALRIAIEIADALQQAHRRGIVHRDLKPGNVIIGPGRGTHTRPTATLLDFGLAKRTPQAAVSLATVAPTAAADQPALTGSGAILGTFQYMAPEQLEGREADARTDIWAFGCLLYEMLTARRAFDAATHAGLVAAVLERQPAAVELPDPALTAPVNRLIAACLEKNPEDRFQSMRDVRRELEWIQHPSTAVTAAAVARRPRWLLMGGVTLLFAAVVATALILVPGRDTGPGVLAPAVFSVTLDSPGYTVGPTGTFGGAGSGTPSVAPDGNRIAFIARSAVESSIWIRDLSSLEAQPLRGTTGARGLFWAPDGRSIGFFAGGKLKAIDLASGRVEIICEAPAGFGGSWGEDGTILFSPEERAPVYRVAVEGGTPSPVTALAATGEHAHRWPAWLPGGRHFLYMSWSDATTKREVRLGSIDGAPPRTLFESQSGAVLAGDHLLYVLDMPARLMAWAFDVKTLELRGKPFALVADENVDYPWVTGEPNATAAGSTLAYTTGKYRRTQPTWVSRAGRPLETVGEVGVYFDPIISPDGARLALERHDPARGSGDIWTVDLSRGAFSRLTAAHGFETTPVWSPDGRVAYASDQGPMPNIYVRTASGAGSEALLVAAGARSFPLDWSADGRHVVFMLNGGATRNDLWIHDIERGTTAALLDSEFNEGWARLSPDGRWIAYVSDESEQREVYVRSFPDGAVKTQVSTAGGGQPQWRGDGRELFYVAPDNTIMAVDVASAAGRLQFTRPQGLFVANIDQNKSIRNQYAVSPDGSRFLVLSLADRNASPIVAVLHWRSLLRH